MNNYVRGTIITVIFPFMLSTSLSAEVRDDYELTVAVAVKANQAWQLYRDEEFAGAFNNGHYTDPDPRTRVNDFWSDGLVAKLDRDDNGHHETIFAIVENELVYVGSIGAKGTFVDAARVYHRYLGLPAASFFRDIYRKKPVNTGVAANVLRI